MSVKYDPLSTVPGYAYTRSGAKSELGSTGTPIAFAANATGVVPNKGYWSRVALTNQVSNSQAAENWPSDGTATVTANAATAPDGTMTADLVEGAGGVANTGFYFYAGATFIGVGSKTFSRVLKAGSLSWARLETLAFTNAADCYFNLSSGTVGSTPTNCTGYITPLTNGFYRCTIVFDPGADLSGFVVVRAAEGDNDFTLTAGSVHNLYAWQADAFDGEFRDGGPIIVTTTGPASVGADVLDVTASLPAGDFIVWVVADLKDGTTASQQILVDFNNVAGTHRLVLYRDGASGPSLYALVGSVAVAGASTGSTQLSGRMAILVRYAAGKFKVYSRNLGTGVENSSTETTATIPSITRAQIGHALGSSQLNGLVEGVYQRNGTFIDAEISSILAAS